MEEKDKKVLEGGQRQPESSPCKLKLISVLTPKKQRVAYDRFITSSGGSDLIRKFNYLANEKTPTKQKRKIPGETDSNKRGNHFLPVETRNQLYQEILVNELLPMASRTPEKNGNLLRFTNTSPTPNSKIKESPLKPFTSSRLTLVSQMALQSPKKLVRYISKTPYKVLDAPELQDDFYLNLVDWSSTNSLGVGLGSCVYLWNGATNSVTNMCNLGPYDSVCSVNWIQRGTHLAVGTNKGFVQIWDVSRLKKIRQFTGHTGRVGSISWNDNVLTSGSRDRSIINRDVRSPADFLSKYDVHKQEVCGLKWSPDGGQLASGGNDNKIYIWDTRHTDPILKFSDHTAAVKAIAWSPHTHGLLASGGGTADRCIRFWNTATNSMLQTVDTGSQVCNLAWSKNSNELVSTHGYSQNQVIVWKYPTMEQVANLTGHTFRVLYLAMSPDGQNIVTGAGDETLRFWTVFNKSRQKQNQNLGTQLMIR